MIKGAFQKFLMISAVVVFLGAGYAVTGGVKSCEAAAAACDCSTCVYPAGVSAAFGRVHDSIVKPAIDAAETQLSAYFQAATLDFVEKLQPAFPWLARKLVFWFDTFWYYNLNPSYQTGTDQLMAAYQAQVFAMSSFSDAAHMVRVKKELEQKELDDHRALRPSGNVCTAGTIMSNMTRATVISRAYNAAAPTELAPRTQNALGSPSETAAAVDTAARWDKYVERYCDATANNGAAGCRNNGAFTGQDIDVTGMIFAPATIDLKNEDVKQSIDDLVTNLVEPITADPIAPRAYNTPDGRANILARQSRLARLQLASDSLYHVISRRAPGAVDNTFIAALRGEVADPLTISSNPSRNEIMRAMIEDRVNSGKYGLRQMDEPENAAREAVIQQALQLMQMSDQLDLMDRYALILAAQVGPALKQSRPSDAMIRAGTVK